LIFNFDISTAANVTQDDPTLTRLTLSHGIIHQLGVGFPPGPAGLLHLQLLTGEHQAWPSNGQGDFNWDGAFFQWLEWYPLEVEPYELVARTWNEDDTYAHGLQIQVSLLPREVLVPVSESLPLLRRISRSLLGAG